MLYITCIFSFIVCHFNLYITRFSSIIVLIHPLHYSPLVIYCSPLYDLHYLPILIQCPSLHPSHTSSFIVCYSPLVIHCSVLYLYTTHFSCITVCHFTLNSFASPLIIHSSTLYPLYYSLLFYNRLLLHPSSFLVRHFTLYTSRFSSLIICHFIVNSFSIWCMWSHAHMPAHAALLWCV